MQVILLSISDDLRKKIKPNSILNHFQEYDLFYFPIPHNLSPSDQNHLINQGTLFFQSQFKLNLVNPIWVGNKKEARKKIQDGKELSWNIFYRFNQWVKVCEGVFDEDLDCFLSDFTGKIIDFYVDDNKNIFLLALSGDSVSKLPIYQLNTIFRDSSPFYTFLDQELIMPDFVPENLLIDEIKKTDILLKLTDFKDYQNEIFEDFSDILKFWLAQFRSNLKGSEQVKINSSKQTGALLVDIPYFCDRFGVWGTFSIGDKNIDIPLIEIEEITSNNYLNKLYQKYQKIMAIMLPN